MMSKKKFLHEICLGKTTKMKVLVTGSAGFIGFHLTQKLLERGDCVIGLDNLNDYYDVDLKYARLRELGIEKESITSTLTPSKRYEKHFFIKASLEDQETLHQLFVSEKFDAVCHLAAQAGVRYSLENPNAYIQSNIVGFLTILECCRHNHVYNLSFASSSSVYGLNRSQPFSTHDHTDHPVSLYAATKKAAEMMAHTYAHLYGICTTGLRFFTVYGPWGRPDMSPFLFANAIINDKPINVFNNGAMSRDFTYIDDITEGVIHVIDSPAKASVEFDPYEPNPSISSAPYKLYNIGNNQPIPLLSFIETLEKTIGKKAHKNFMPMQDGDVVSTYANIDDLVKDFSYKPYTDITEGIENFIQWYKQFYKIDFS